MAEAAPGPPDVSYQWQPLRHWLAEGLTSLSHPPLEGPPSELALAAARECVRELGAPEAEGAA
eukprot:12832982-Alexandrium_andersonii.AAC.1